MKNTQYKDGTEMNTNPDIFTDESKLLMYATDASSYKEKPLGVCYPKSAQELRNIVIEAFHSSTAIIPRGAGTSLAGQVVGNGLVADVSRYMNRIIELNREEKWVRVEPGVVLDELNLFLHEHSLYFGPETSTSNRCTIGGMVGNNSSGLRSLVYGTTREHIISLTCILSDGTEAEFGPLSREAFDYEKRRDDLVGKIYRQIDAILSVEENQELIRKEYPDPGVVRRNTGYALDELMDCALYNPKSDKAFNMSRLIAGSEGTLALISEIKLCLVDLPPSEKVLVCIHFQSVNEAIRGNLVALGHQPVAVELMDDKILKLTEKNIEQRKNRFFVQGDPGAILIVELNGPDSEQLMDRAEKMIKDFRKRNLGYHFPVVSGKDIKKVWNLRKAGLGVLSNMPGDARPVSVIEDTSVNPRVLEAYIDEFNKLLDKHKLECVYHAHISVGELHLRPILNLKAPGDVELFREIARESALLVKKFRGSLSGEHGDGRLRGEFIPIMVGEKIYSWFKEIKETWDPKSIVNPGKITNTPAMNSFLRYIPGKETPEIPTIFDFSAEGGMMRAIEKCNGSGDCRKSSLIGGTMCPSYMAGKDEDLTTRARANILREYLGGKGLRPDFGQKEIYDILDLCLSCKACKAECPSNVDMAKLKAEFLQKYYDIHGVPLRSRLIANITFINKLGSLVPSLFNSVMASKPGKRMKNFLGFAPERNIPEIAGQTLNRWLKKNLIALNEGKSETAREICFFIDEFTNYNDVETGKKAILLLSGLGYRISMVKHTGSGRSFISKGLLRKARKMAKTNLLAFKGSAEKQIPIVGIEPSAILSFRDEYPDFFRGRMKELALTISGNIYTFEEFLAREMKSDRISKDSFSSEAKHIGFHGHCQQKAIASTEASRFVLSFPKNYEVEEISSGCCGMAGSFGYEKEHYDLSMKVGELVLFPAIRAKKEAGIFAAPGTSCRHQIMDGTGEQAYHPAEILYDAFIEKKDLK